MYLKLGGFLFIFEVTNFRGLTLRAQTNLVDHSQSDSHGMSSVPSLQIYHHILTHSNSSDFFCSWYISPASIADCFPQ